MWVTALLAMIAGGRGWAAEPSPRVAREGAELIGSKPPAWDVREWIGSPPLTLAGLRGKVVLVRWFTDTECPYCHATAPTLNRFHATTRAAASWSACITTSATSR